MAGKPSMFRNRAEAWGARAIAKVGVNWERGWKGRVEGTLYVSGALFPTFLGLAITQIGGDSVTGLWVILSVVSIWVALACVWLNTRYSDRNQSRQLSRIEGKLSRMSF